MSSYKLGDVIKRFNMTIQQATEILAEHSSLAPFISDINFVLNRKQYDAIRRTAEQIVLSKKSSKQSTEKTTTQTTKEIPISALTFYDDEVIYTDNGVKYRLKLSGISRYLETKKYEIDGQFSKIRIKLNTQTNELNLNPKVCTFLWDYNKKILDNKPESESLESVSISSFTFEDGLVILKYKKKEYYHEDLRSTSYKYVIGNYIKSLTYTEWKEFRNTRVKVNLDHKTKKFDFVDFDLISYVNGLKREKEVIKASITPTIKASITPTTQTHINKQPLIKGTPIPLNLFIFNDGYMQLDWQGKRYTYWDSRIRASYMNLIKGTVHGKNRRKHGLAPLGTMLNTILFPKSRTMEFGRLDIYEFLEGLYHNTRKETSFGLVKNGSCVTESCTIDNINFGTNKYSVVFKCGSKLLDPFEEHESGCVPVLNVVCNYLKEKIPTDILVEHQGKRVNRIITKFKIQNFIQYLLSIKNDHDAEYWGIVQNEEKRTLAQIYSSSIQHSKKSVLRRNGYIDILSSYQSPDKILLLSYEVSNSDKEEDVFIFSHRYSQKWILIMENVCPERATEVFVTTDEMYDNCILNIFDYFTNYELERKRDSFSKKKIDPIKFHSLDYFTIDHDNIPSWLNKINKICTLVPKFQQPFVFVKGLRISKQTSERNTKEHTTVVSHLHEEMKKLLYEQKVKEYGEENVGTENQIGNKRIDLVVKKGNLYDFYEIKTFEDPGKCVQEAFGQVLIYAKMSCWECIDNLFIVGPNDIDYNENWLVKSDNYDKSLSVSYISLPTENNIKEEQI